jgi:uncharacterized membrane protein
MYVRGRLEGLASFLLCGVGFGAMFGKESPMKRSRFTEALKALALVNLILSAIAALILFALLSEAHSDAKVFYVIAGFGVAFQGVIGFVFLTVIAEIADNLVAIREAQQPAKPIDVEERPIL